MFRDHRFDCGMWCLDENRRPPAAHVVTYNNSMDLTLSELEQAINYWRALRPSTGEERALSPEVNALATVYAMMIFQHTRTVPVESLPVAAQQLLDSWRRQAV
jgi:hypothetical protein